MDTVLIIGSKGMLGTALMSEFADGYEVIGLDRPEIDITNSEQTSEQIKALQPAVVINVAAHNAVDLIETDEKVCELAKNINGVAVGELGKITKELGIPLVHFSTDYVFKGDNENGYTEEMTPEPVSRYGETKLLGEKMLREATDKFYLIRLSRLFGPVGESEMSKKSFVDTMLDAVLKNGKTELDVVDEERSCPTYSIDLAKTVREILEKKMPCGIYHAANSGACTWYEFAKEIFRIKNIAVKINPVQASKFPRPAKRPAFSELLSTKMPEMRSWQEALADYLR